MQSNDTILAVSSPQGPGGIRAIVRLSGPEAWKLAQNAARFPPEAEVGWHEAMYEFDGLSVAGHLLLFKAPRSFTGEDVAELHVPGSPALVGMLMQALLRDGAGAVRMAEPGEFSARAFFNGKMDLTEAEGIAATISAASETELRAAASLRSGDLHRWAHATAERLANLLALVEAGIDFVDEEDVHFVQVPELIAALAALSREIEQELAAAVRIDRLAAPPTVVFVGKPNVGKSSLINALAGRERSIVSPIAGTTRDMLAAEMAVDGKVVRLIDVPGDETATDELREKMMAARAAALLDADVVVEVFATDDTASLPEDERRRVAIFNKTDLLAEGDIRLKVVLRAERWRRVSAQTGEHIEELRAALGRLAVRNDSAGASRLVLNHRHRELMQQTLEAIHRAEEIVTAAASRPELLAAELRQALDTLGQMTGTISPDEVLGKVFAQFCIGK